ncbi:unnamed protein product [Cylindrotheca closterium]|uniref:Ion transport domain-containing protein n=1 Tax=Cylindrotheca closterium TaxID=2856 RepID=A0AAD2PUP3_9STRA|nr:unnamed protein product [Cylindrotheca closterium]
MGIQSNFASPSERQRPQRGFAPDPKSNGNDALASKESPWVKDRRMYAEKKRNQQQFKKRVRRFEASPVGSASTTSTSSAHSTPSPTQHQKSTNPFAGPSPLNHRLPMQATNTNPFAGPSPLNHRPLMQASNTPTARRNTNPFEESTNPFETSTNPFDAPSNLETSFTPQMRNVRRTPTGEMSVDSLNEVLEGGYQEGGYQMPSTYSLAEESETTTLSDQAIEAAKALKKSFYTRKGNPGSTPRRPQPATISETAQHNPEVAFSQDRPMPAQSRPAKRRPRINRPLQTQRRTGPVDLDITLDTADFTADADNLQLHDMCDAAQSTNDATWRKAIFLLSVEPHMAKNMDPVSKMTAMHVCSLGVEPPPIWMTRALLYTHPEQTQHTDSGGRLPLHLLAATSADIDTMQLMVEEYPASVGHRDDRGFTPLQLMLKNDQIVLALQHLRILLGQTVKENEEEQLAQIKFRKGEHLHQSPEELQLQKKQQQEKRHEVLFANYPDDVRSCLNKIQLWKHRQVTKGLLFRPTKLFASADSVNPAAVATPTGKLLPLHLLVRRKPQAAPSRLVSRPPGTATDLIRILVNSYPQALVTTDAQARTPLMTAMMQTDYQPNQEIIELLLGFGTPGFNVGPAESPAAIAASQTFQLPLHIAAEEMTSNYNVLSTIYEAYPQAVCAQDVRGRTPLHLALRNFRSIPVDEPTLALLFEDKVARLKDHDGKTPFDLVLRNPDFLKPSKSMILQEFLDSSILRPKDLMESEDLLFKLRSLPPWIRNHACAANHVQEVLVDELTSPFITFWILFNGAVMISLLVLLRMLLDAPTSTLLTAIYVVSSLLLVNQVIYWLEAILVGEFYRLCASNPWRWIDVFSGYLTLATAYLIAADMSALESVVGTTTGFVPTVADPLISTIGSIATGFIWISLVGYFVEWWCGMAVFFGSAMELLRSLVWPLALAAAGIVGMSQVMYTLDDCGQEQTCSVSDTYTTVYWMVLGEPILSNEESSTNMASAGMVAMVVSFTLLWIWWILSVVVVAVTEARQLNRIQIALKWYWEPKIALTVLSGGRRKAYKKKIRAKPSFVRRSSEDMGRIWHVFVASFRGDVIRDKQRDTYWYSCFNKPGVIHFTRLLAVIVVPVWLVLGSASLGLLWPPQVRRWLFSTNIVKSRGVRQSSFEEQLTASKLSSLKGELLAFQSTTSQQTHMTQKDIQEIKDLLYAAMGQQ